MATLAKLDRPSETRPSAKALPCGAMAAATAAATSASTETMLNSVLERPWKAPQTSRPRAEIARISSGRTRQISEEVMMPASPARRAAPGGDQSFHRGAGDVEDDVGLEAQVQGRDDQGHEDEQLALVQVGDLGQRRVGHLAEDGPTIEAESIDRRQDHPGGGEEGRPGRGAVDAGQGQDLADEAAGSRQADVAHGEQHEHRRIPGHAVDEAAVEGDLTGVHAVVDDADAEEERA